MRHTRLFQTARGVYSLVGSLLWRRAHTDSQTVE
jgi:hypothetical protein